MGLADGVIEAAQGRRARAPGTTDARGDHARPHPRILADNKKNKKQVKWLTVKKNFQDFFTKKGFCFHSAKICTRPGRILNTSVRLDQAHTML